MPDTNEPTPISQLGEFGLIERIAKNFEIKRPESIKGIGDDAAIINHEGYYTVVSTDLLLEGIHFDLVYTPLKHLGYKAAIANISDIAAMNAYPTQLTVSLGLTAKFSVEAVDALYEGFKAACNMYNVDLVGGDTTSSASGLVISVTAIGKQTADKIVYRNGAADGDILCVTGDLGAAYLGLQVLIREKKALEVNFNMDPLLEKYQYILSRFLKPEARTDIVHELADLNLKPTAMIDISDGLASEALHIGRQSGLEVVLYEEKLPFHEHAHLAADEFKIVPSTPILNGGEDYELLMAVSQADFSKIENHHDILPVGLLRKPTSQGNILVTSQNNVYPLKAQGWTHLNKQQNGG